MIKTTHFCDRCGAEEGADWDNRIFRFEMKLPEDGCNGGQIATDLCRSCRQEFWIVLKPWLDAFKKMEPK